MGWFPGALLVDERAGAGGLFASAGALRLAPAARAFKARALGISNTTEVDDACASKANSPFCLILHGGWPPRR